MLDRPIFIIGIGRCGSSVFFSLLSHHSELSWISNYCDQHPTRYRSHRKIMNMLDWPVIGKLIRRRIVAREAYNFWDSNFRGFSTPCRDLEEQDVSEVTKDRVQKALGELVTERRNRLLVKITGWSRIGAIRKIYPDAKFIHIVRDGYSVANSLLQVPWWWGWRGPENWRFGKLSPSDQAIWEQHDRSFVALAALEWRLIMDATRKTRSQVDSENFLEVRYEDLCVDKHGVYDKVLEFAGLSRCDKFDAVLSSTELANTNDKWRRDLSASQIKIMQSVLKDSRADYGYDELS